MLLSHQINVWELKKSTIILSQLWAFHSVQVSRKMRTIVVRFLKVMHKIVSIFIRLYLVTWFAEPSFTSLVKHASLVAKRPLYSSKQDIFKLCSTNNLYTKGILSNAGLLEP